MDSGRRNTCERMWGLQEDGGTRMADSTAPVHCRPMISRKAKTLQKEWLEKLGALQFVLTLYSVPFFFLLLFHLLFTRLWSLSVLYMLWLYLDRDTPSQGGRRFVWPTTWAIWKYQRDYFPIKLVKTAELPPSQNYVLGSHPHGIMCTGAFSNFLTESNNFSRLFPGLQPWTAMMAIFFYVPLFREYIMAGGLRPASRHSLDFVLSQPQRGQAVVIVPGGAQEALYTARRRHRLELLNRKGFVRLALRHGASLVPVYSFGENDTFRCKAFSKRSWQYLCQVTCKRVTSIAPCIFWGRGLFSHKSCGLLPLPVPITTVVGGPIPVPQCSSPSEEQVDHYHRLYMDALERLFEEHKESCGVPASTHLTFY
ncbi:2-acylglycerol O-acyltransferase 3-like isoform X1 [Oryctolagus cuniculus]|uniref:2-acylglycerol O-acyltransferase 3-like isoform X1 n=1 Tax=Oryctolagus cuniculus TaxID=9986 RepID=UPI00048D6D1F|nr:2-acylglycerol O-acyltransferase 3-like isoform X1 [Oryctolagus cuniculus]